MDELFNDVEDVPDDAQDDLHEQDDVDMDFLQLANGDDAGGGDDDDDNDDDNDDDDNDDNDDDNEDNDEDMEDDNDEDNDQEEENDDDEEMEEDDEEDDDSEQPTQDVKMEGTEASEGQPESVSADTESGEANEDAKESTRTSANGDTAHEPSQPRPRVDSTSSPRQEQQFLPRQLYRVKAQLALNFDIIPLVAIPYAGQCQSLAFTSGPKWILTGGEDGFIRKYDFIQSIEGKLPLTMAQKHNLVDLITKAGVIVLYWENEQPVTTDELLKLHPKLKPSDLTLATASYEPKTSPVYALEAQKLGLWCLSGVQLGGISLYSMRHSEGQIQYYFRDAKLGGLATGHLDAVSVLKLNADQTQFLSGSWDKTVKLWDLNTGGNVMTFAGSTGQISSIQFRPQELDSFVMADPGGSDNNQNNDDVDLLFGSDDDEGEKGNEPKKEVPSLLLALYPNSQVFMSSSIDGTINIWDIRSPQAVLKLGVPNGTPPWCMSLTWSNDGYHVFAGRRNSTVEEFDLKMPHIKSVAGNLVPNVLKTLVFPKILGPVLTLATMPNENFLLCGSVDNIRLYNLKLYDDLAATGKKQATPFTIIPGHHGGVLSCLWVDDTGRFMVSASGNRGWGQSNYTETVIIYEIDFDV